MSLAKVFQPFLFLFILTFKTLIFASQIGDFAPLNIGNIWTYYSKSHYKTEDDSIIITSHLDKKLIIKDTTYYIFTNSRKGAHINLGTYKTNIDTTSIDTLIEIGNSIKECNNWGANINPVYMSHQINKDSLIDSLGSYYYVYIPYIPSVQTYKSDIGLVTSTYPAFNGPNSSTILVSFQNNNSKITKTNSSKSQNCLTKNRLYKKANFIVIKTDERVYNFLGKKYSKN